MNDKTPDAKTVEDILKLGKQQVIETEIGGVPVILAPNNMQTFEFEKLIDARAERPRQLEQCVEALSIESFLQYWNRFADEKSTIFADIEHGKFVGVIDYHETPAEPRRKLHKVIYNCPFTKEWNDWTENNDTPLEQIEFALFVEDHMRQFETPSGGDMMKIALTIKSKTDVEFESGQNISNGEVKFAYKETLNGQAGINGEMSIPEEFTLALRPFQNGAAYKIPARFRYRKNPSGIKMWYTLQQPHLILEDAINDIYSTIENGIESEKGQVLKGKI